MIPANTPITFTVVGDTAGLIPTSVDGVRGVVLDMLAPNFTVQNVLVTNLRTMMGGGGSLYWNWSYKATVRLTTRVEYRDIQDIDSIVAHAFYEAGGSLPTVTANGFEQGQDPPTETSIGLYVLLGVVGLVATAVILVRVK